MKTAEEIEHFIDYRDSLHKELRGGIMMYDIPKYYRWLSEKDLIEYWINHVHTSHPTTLPSDEEIALKAGERLSRLTLHDPIQRELTETEKTVSVSGYIAGAKDMRSPCEAKIEEMEREMKRLRFMIDNGLGAKDIQNDI